MSRFLSRSIRSILLGSIMLSAAQTAGCASGTSDSSEVPASDSEVSGQSKGPNQVPANIVDVDQTAVKRQSIGNCWVYAPASWIESMNKTATGTEINISESYTTFWHWFEQITTGDLVNGQIGTGGRFDIAKTLILKYGVSLEKDFIATEATSEMSSRQDAALKAMQTVLSRGALASASSRSDRTLVFNELTKAWKLTSTVITQLKQVFGEDVSRSLLVDKKAGTSSGTPTGTFVKTAASIPASYALAPGKARVTKTLATALDDWRVVKFSARTATQRRDFEKRLQRALHDRQPVITSWFVDFNSLDDKGQFLAVPKTPGHQGGHMTVLEDYEIDNVPGFGSLKAGVVETRAAALTAALSDTAAMKFIRVKNSWGISREDRNFVVPGYNDLYMPYLYGTAKRCALDANENPKLDDCTDMIVWSDIVLPSGY